MVDILALVLQHDEQAVPQRSLCGIASRQGRPSSKDHVSHLNR